MFLLEKILDNEDGNVVSLLFLRSLHQMSQCHVIVHWHEMSAVSANINFGLYSVKFVRSWILLFLNILVQKEKNTSQSKSQDIVVLVCDEKYEKQTVTKCDMCFLTAPMMRSRNCSSHCLKKKSIKSLRKMKQTMEFNTNMEKEYVVQMMPGQSHGDATELQLQAHDEFVRVVLQTSAFSASSKVYRPEHKIPVI